MPLGQPADRVTLTQHQLGGPLAAPPPADSESVGRAWRAAPRAEVSGSGSAAAGLTHCTGLTHIQPAELFREGAECTGGRGGEGAGGGPSTVMRWRVEESPAVQATTSWTDRGKMARYSVMTGDYSTPDEAPTREDGQSGACSVVMLIGGVEDKQSYNC